MAACAFRAAKVSALMTCSQMLQPLRQQSMPLIDSLRNDPSGLLQSNNTVLINFNQPIEPQVFHRHADTGLGKGKLVGNVNGAHMPMPLLQHQDRLQIVFRRFPNLYGLHLLSNS